MRRGKRRKRPPCLASPARTEIHHDLKRLLEHACLLVLPEGAGRVLVERSVTVCKRDMKHEIKHAAIPDCKGGSVADAALEAGSARLEHACAAHSKKKATRACCSLSRRLRIRTRLPMGSGLPGESHPLRAHHGAHTQLSAGVACTCMQHAHASRRQTHGACWSSEDTCTRTMHPLVHLLSDRCRASVASSDELHGLFRTE